MGVPSPRKPLPSFLGSISRGPWCVSSDMEAVIYAPELSEVKSKLGKLLGYCPVLHILSSGDFLTYCMYPNRTPGSASREPGLVQGLPIGFTNVGWPETVFPAKFSQLKFQSSLDLQLYSKGFLFYPLFIFIKLPSLYSIQSWSLFDFN